VFTRTFLDRPLDRSLAVKMAVYGEPGLEPFTASRRLEWCHSPPEELVGSSQRREQAKKASIKFEPIAAFGSHVGSLRFHFFVLGAAAARPSGLNPRRFLFGPERF
jgi:hypothetical protein